MIAKDIKKIVTKQRRGSKITFKPIIQYQYSVNDRQYTSSTLTPINKSFNYNLAKNIFNFYKIDSKITAHYDPSKPEDSYLLKVYIFWPYTISLFAVSLFCITLSVYWSLLHSSKDSKIPVKIGTGKYELISTAALSARLKSIFIPLIIWHAAGLALFGHYTLVSKFNVGNLILIGSAIYEIVGCIYIYLLIKYVIIAFSIKDAKVIVNANEFRLGEEILVNFEQKFKRNLKINKLDASLICEKSTEDTRGKKRVIIIKEIYKKCIIKIDNPYIYRGELIERSNTVAIPGEMKTSTPDNHETYPQYKWHFKVINQIKNCPDYELIFPICVMGKQIEK